ncbi:uncharacterized protein [Rutidosis leptorrhynchoides]|uniref:uncharacterized protein n=1 Tax=Rutidosis leptorrhynchoides TaxID=125765 RepID=UPI003A990C4A
MENPVIAAPNKRRLMLESMYSVITIVFILVACVELCDASTVVDVYRLIQYDLAGAPYGSRVSSLNHHAVSSLFAPGSDLSRTVVILPLRELNETFVREYIESGKPLGGLLLLLPQFFNPEITPTDCLYVGKENLKDTLADLEKKLIRATIQVSEHTIYVQ